MKKLKSMTYNQDKNQFQQKQIQNNKDHSISWHGHWKKHNKYAQEFKGKYEYNWEKINSIKENQMKILVLKKHLK